MLAWDGLRGQWGRSEAFGDALGSWIAPGRIRVVRLRVVWPQAPGRVWGASAELPVWGQPGALAGLHAAGRGMHFFRCTLAWFSQAGRQADVACGGGP